MSSEIRVIQVDRVTTHNQGAIREPVDRVDLSPNSRIVNRWHDEDCLSSPVSSIPLSPYMDFGERRDPNEARHKS